MTMETDQVNRGKTPRVVAKPIAKLFDSLLTLDELRESLGGRFAKQTLYNWVANAGMPKRKLGGRLYFDPNEVAQWLKRKKLQ
jgi:predicted DNA-binding transcriptional regulator AlpA